LKEKSIDENSKTIHPSMQIPPATFDIREDSPAHSDHLFEPNSPQAKAMPGIHNGKMIEWQNN
jgi:hypothetical protein